MKYHLITLGCQMNLSDSERVVSVLDEAGYTWTDNEEEAGMIGILACSVRQKAIDKVYSRIHKWNKWKNHKNESQTQYEKVPRDCGEYSPFVAGSHFIH